MSKMCRFVAPALLAGLLAANAAPALAAWSHDPSVNNPVNTFSQNQYFENAIPDGEGGAFALWMDTRSAPASQVVQHLLSTGDIAPGWPITGAQVATPTGIQSEGSILADGSGGVYVTWSEKRGVAPIQVYLQRLTSTGDVSPGWPADGLQVSDDPKDQVTPRLCSDNAGGVYVTWTRNFSVNDQDPGLARVLPDGSIASGFPLWMDISAAFQKNAQIVPDAFGNVIAAYQDNAGGNYELHLKKFSPSGGMMWNQVIGPFSGDQTEPLVVADGFNGAIVAYSDAGILPFGVSVLRVNASGMQLWQVVALSAGSDTRLAALVTDGAHGAYALSKPLSIFSNTWSVTRVAATGYISTGWPVGTGKPVAGGTFTAQARISPDGAGGLLSLAWSSYESLKMSRWTSTGGSSSVWPSTSTGVETAIVPLISEGTVVPDGSGGGVAVWGDARNGLDSDIYAQRVDRFGKLGNAEPSIVSVKDVALDQGGSVRVSWTPSYLDADPAYGIQGYHIWRQLPVNAAQQAIARGAASVSPGDELPEEGRRVVMARPNGAEVTYWELAGSQTASALPAYSFRVSTAGDSTAEGFAHTVCMVQAVGTYGGFWDSAADSGYSVDNLAPARPAPFAAAWGGATHLTWGPNTEADLAGYRLYRGATPGFVPGPSTFWAETPDTGLVAPAGSFHWKLVAFDVHGNVSPAALVSPPGSVGVEFAPPAALAFSLISANPSRGTAQLRLALPRATRLSVTVYDAAGRLVSTLADGERAAGEHALEWDGRDAGGAGVQAGLYFARLVVGGETRTLRLVRL